MRLGKWIGAAAGALAMASGAAQAQSNALGAGSPGPAGATRDLSAAIAKGYAPFSLGAFEAYVTTARFTVQSRQSIDGGTAAAIAVTAPNAMPFLFVFRDCGRQGCLFMEAIQPFAPGRVGVPMGVGDINAYNRASPLQVFMTAEADGQVAIRYALPALAGCGDACAHSAVNLYFGAVLAVYEAVTKASKQMVVEAPFEEAPERALDFAALAANAAPELSMDARWGAASAAFGEAGLANAAGDLAARLEREADRLRDAAKPGGTEFPALIRQ